MSDSDPLPADIGRYVLSLVAGACAGAVSAGLLASLWSVEPTFMLVCAMTGSTGLALGVHFLYDQ